MSATPSDSDWVLVARHDGCTRMNMYCREPIRSSWPWLIVRALEDGAAPAWNVEMDDEDVQDIFAGWPFVRASRAEAEALIAMARAEAALSDAP